MPSNRHDRAVYCAAGMVAGRECVVCDALTEAAGKSFAWSVACLEDGIGQEVLRELFAADQQHLQVRCVSRSLVHCCTW